MIVGSFIGLIRFLSIVFHVLASCMLTPLSVDEILLLRYVNWSTNFRCLSLRVEMAASYVKLMNSVLFAFMLRLMSPVDRSSLCSWDSPWVGEFSRSARSS